MVIFELLSKKLPFGYQDPFQLQQNILALSITWPKKIKFTRKLKDFIWKFLKMNPKKRYRRTKALQHSYLKNLNFEGIEQRIVRPPFQPQVSSTIDTALFTANQRVPSPFPLLAQKEKLAWNQELAQLMSEEQPPEIPDKQKPGDPGDVDGKKPDIKTKMKKLLG